MHTSLIMSTNRITVTVDEKTLENLDEFRGLTKRSTIIQEIISDYLDKKGVKVTQNPHPKPTRIKRGSNIV